ncbi:peroxidase family protein [Medicago truncatula]|uniref:Peroxidase n=1 Tax=Medicago truncatula TaxID=3880 RepID=A0A072VJI6_MEDTR|nr:peroxidase family protein [Medicago truncatula]
MRRFFIFNTWILVAFIAVLPVLLSLRTTSFNFYHTSFRSVKLAGIFPFDFSESIRDGSNLRYNFYKDSCPEAENIVRSAVTDIYSDHRDLAPSLLRLFFHDCFIQGCDASLLLEDRNISYEKQAIPNQTLKGFDKVDLIKEEVEQACPGVVSCADILALAARDSVFLGGGPFYPVLTGRRDSLQSFFQEAADQIPRPDDNITRTLHLFNLRGFKARETVSLLGEHNIGKIGCDFIQQRLYDFQGTGQPDPSIPLDFLSQMRQNCPDNNKNNVSSNGMFSTFTVSKPMNVHHSNNKGMSYKQALSSAVSSGASFDTHYYQRLLRGRGLLFADQQLMAEEKTAKLVSAYASDDGSTFRMDFARVMMKLSNLDVLTGNQGQVRLNCSRVVSS